MPPETATATNPTDASASAEASATATATAAAAADTTQQTPPVQTPPAAAAETPAAAATTTETPVASTVPEKYEFRAPEGTEFDPEVLESYSGAAKEAGLTQDAAQKLIEKMAPALAARQADQVQAIHEEWRQQSAADKEFGGDKLAENLAVGKKALDTFGTPELRALLDDTGLGNHPEVIRLFYRAGKAISEDKFVGGSPSGAGKLNATNVLYDKTTPKG